MLKMMFWEEILGNKYKNEFCSDLHQLKYAEVKIVYRYMDVQHLFTAIFPAQCFINRDIYH